MLSPDAKAIWRGREGGSLMAALLGKKPLDDGDRETAKALAGLAAGEPDDELDAEPDVMAGDEAILFQSRSPGLAFDRASVRRIDQDGRLHVEITNISKATVNPYLGREIPNFEELGLSPDRVYQLLRDPEELEKGAPSFNNIPLLSKHKPVHAAEPQKELVVGSTGTDAVFEAPFLKNSLVVWDAEAIERIDSQEARELSCAYRYVPVMEPGTYEGVRYDGRMTQLIGNHVALVTTGRAGPDVIVGDESQLKKEPEMKSKPLSRHAMLAKGALLGSVMPMLAADAKLDLNALLTGVTAANWVAKKAGIAHAIKPKLAADADIEDVVQLLDKLNPDGSTPDDCPPGKNDDMSDAIDADPAEEVLAMLRGKISDEDLAAVGAKIKALMTPAVDGEVPAALAEAKPEAKPEDKPGDKPKPLPAMDAAAVKKLIDGATAEVRRQTREAAEAREIVRPYVGSVSVALDSGEAIYKAALELLHVKTDGIHPSGLRAVLEAQPKPGAAQRIALDAAPAQDFASRFPLLNAK